jgi:hypothetical protein
MKSQRVYGAAYGDWGWKNSEPKKPSLEKTRENKLRAAIRRLQYAKEKP